MFHHLSLTNPKSTWCYREALSSNLFVAPDQKKWLDKMVDEGKIAVPPGGTLEKGSVISMFMRMLIHNAMEEQMRQAAIDAEDEDDDDDE
jgi:hypothetical protein